MEFVSETFFEFWCVVPKKSKAERIAFPTFVWFLPSQAL
jgi:hypothetical protein